MPGAGRSLSLLDPTYASKYIPIIASVSEHQPPAWPSYFTDLHIASVLMPAGLIALFWPLTSASMFLILYACTAVYFSGVMVCFYEISATGANLQRVCFKYTSSRNRADCSPGIKRGCPQAPGAWMATVRSVACK